ncbi:MAG: hypothetical protein AABZ39_06155 [Spirochaetota bacterium]
MESAFLEVRRKLLIRKHLESRNDEINDGFMSGMKRYFEWRDIMTFEKFIKVMTGMKARNNTRVVLELTKTYPDGMPGTVEGEYLEASENYIILKHPQAITAYCMDDVAAVKPPAE